MPIEIKSGQTVTRDFFTGLNRWLALAGAAATNPKLIYGGLESYRRNDIDLVAWNLIKPETFPGFQSYGVRS